MDNSTHRAIVIYRTIVFLLCSFYGIRTLVFADFSYFGGPFRYLTIWALYASWFSSIWMLAFSLNKVDHRWEGFVGVATVLNTMVVLLYWRLYFADPLSVTSDGELGRWWLEYYMHALGPLLQWIDAIVIHRSFRRPLRSAGILTFAIIGYVVWVERVVAPMNDRPMGSVTSGLPYNFLNNLEWAGRLEFYVTNLVVALFFLTIFSGLGWLSRRILGPEAHPIRRDS